MYRKSQNYYQLGLEGKKVEISKYDCKDPFYYNYKKYFMEKIVRTSKTS